MSDINKNVNVKVNWHGQNAKKGASNLKSGMKSVGAETDKLNKKSKGLFANMSKGMTFVSGIIAGQLVRGVVNLGKKLVNAAGKYEQLNIAFETMIGNADEARKVIADLEAFSAKTPFTSDQVNNAAKSLLAFGFAADELIPTLKTLGDVSAGTGKDLGELGIIFGQIRAAGRLTGQDLLQLINAGFSPLQQISEKTGRSMRDLKDDMSKGAISFEMVQQAFKDATSEGGRFFNLTEKQSVSLLGRISTLQSVFQIFARNMGQKIAPAVGKVTEKLIDLFSEEDSLNDVTQELIKANREYAKITETLEKASQNLTEKERRKLEVRRAELKLNIVDSLRLANKLYNEQTKTIPRVEKSIKHYNSVQEKAFQNIKALEKGTFEYNGAIAKGSTQRILLQKWLALYRFNMQKVAEKQIELTKRTNEYDDSIDTLARGLKNGVISQRELIGLDEKLVKLAIERAKTIKIVGEESKKSSEKELAAAKKTSNEKRKLITEIIEFGKDKEQDLTGFTIDQLQKRLSRRQGEAQATKEAWTTATSAISSALGRLSSGAQKMFDNTVQAITGVAKVASGDLRGLLDIAVSIFNFVADAFETSERRQAQAEQDMITRMERIELAQAQLRVKQLEEERNAALESLNIAKDRELARFELTAENYDNMTDSARAYYDILKAEEDEEFANMSEDEKKKFLAKKKYDEEKLKAEKKHNEKIEAERRAFDEAIKAANIEVAKIQLKIALARVETDRSEAESRLNKEYWAPWDKEKKNAEWQKMQGLYNDIRSDLESQLANIGGLQRGGVIDGFGGGDRRHAMLEDGEAVLPKEWQINPFPFFNQLLNMRDKTTGANNSVQNMMNKTTSFEGANFYFQGSNAQEVIEELQEIAENSGSRIFMNA